MKANVFLCIFVSHLLYVFIVGAHDTPIFECERKKKKEKRVGHACECIPECTRLLYFFHCGCARMPRFECDRNKNRVKHASK